MNEIFNIDCIEFMKTKQDNSFDISITSPPYNIGKKLGRKGYVYYDKYNDNKKTKDYLYFIDNVLNELVRVSRYYVFFNVQDLSGNKGLMNLIYNNYNVKETFIWAKSNAGPSINPYVVHSSFEYIFCITKEKEKRNFKYCNFNNHKGDKVQNIIIKNVNSEKNGHNFAFPLWLPKYFIKHFSKEGDLIYDPFMGSGTTAIASLSLKRNYVGTEISENYVNIANKRIENYVNQIELF